MLRITDTIAIEDWELTEQFVRSGGPEVALELEEEGYKDWTGVAAG